MLLTGLAVHEAEHQHFVGAASCTMAGAKPCILSKSISRVSIAFVSFVSKNKKPAELVRVSGLRISVVCCANSAKHPRRRAMRVMVVMTMSKVNHEATINETLLIVKIKLRQQPAPGVDTALRGRLQAIVGILHVPLGVRVYDSESNQNRARQHDYPYVQSGVKSLVARSSSQKSRRGAGGAQTKIKFLQPSVGNGEKIEKNRGHNSEGPAQNPRTQGHRRSQPNTAGGTDHNHLPQSNCEEHDRMHQRYNGALTVSQDGEFAHA